MDAVDLTIREKSVNKPVTNKLSACLVMMNYVNCVSFLVFLRVTSSVCNRYEVIVADPFRLFVKFLVL